MKSIARWGFALAFFPLAACTSNPVNPDASTLPQPVVPTASVNAVDQQFAIQAAESDQFEIQSSQIALERARSPRIRQFAQRMIDAHTQTTQQLTQIATSKGITVQPALEPQQMDMIASLRAAPAGAFDRAYLHDQVVGHRAAVTVHQNEIANGQDPDLKDFAQRTLPIIQGHLRDARAIGGR